MSATALATAGPLALAKPACRGEPLRVGQHGFKFFDELYYDRKPDLTSQGLAPIHVAYTWAIWGERSIAGELGRNVPYDSIATYPARYGLDRDPPDKMILDIEHWKLHLAPSEEVQHSIERYRQAFLAFRQVLSPKTRLTYYNIGPMPTYFYKVEGSYRDSDYTKWRKDNDLMAPLVECFDFICPSLYFQRALSFAQWRRRAGDFIAEARRLVGDDRMVIPFLWPEYADLDKFGHVPTGIWRDKLNFIMDKADSVVLWRRAGAEELSIWNNDAEWWQETKRAMKKAS